MCSTCTRLIVWSVINQYFISFALALACTPDKMALGYGFCLRSRTLFPKREDWEALCHRFYVMRVNLAFSRFFYSGSDVSSLMRQATNPASSANMVYWDILTKKKSEPWPNRLASRRKFWTFVQLAFRLATYLRGLVSTSDDLWTLVDLKFGRKYTQVFLPFGHPAQVDTSWS